MPCWEKLTNAGRYSVRQGLGRQRNDNFDVNGICAFFKQGNVLYFYMFEEGLGRARLKIPPSRKFMSCDN